MAIRINNDIVIRNDTSAALGMINFGSYTSQELMDLVVVGETVGEVVFNIDEGIPVFWNGERWGKPSFSGGIKIDTVDAQYGVFLEPGQLNLPMSANLEILVVGGGGGGGGGYYGGGGGAGGIAHVTGIQKIQSGLYQVTVGNSGAGGSNPGADGQDSVITGPDNFLVTAKGGGGGGGRSSPARPGGSGGGTGLPGGGVTATQPTINHSLPSTAVTNYGNPGWDGAYGSGGGGAGFRGNPGPGTNASTRSGGDGFAFENFPSAIIAPVLATASPLFESAVTDSGFYGGGGGGGAYPTPRGHIGGLGGGGEGQQPFNTSTKGVDFTGGGGGGAYPSGGIGKPGGKGIVIVRLPLD